MVARRDVVHPVDDVDDAAHVEAALAARQAAAEVEVVDRRAVELGHLVERGAHDRRREVVGPQVLERALARPADGRAGGGDDDGLGHTYHPTASVSPAISRRGRRHVAPAARVPVAPAPPTACRRPRRPGSRPVPRPPRGRGPRRSRPPRRPSGAATRPATRPDRIPRGGQAELQPGEQEMALAHPAQDQLRGQLGLQLVVRPAGLQLLSQRDDVLGQGGRDVLGQPELEGLAGPVVRRAAALAHARLAVDRPVGQATQSLVGGHLGRGGHQLLPAGRELGHARPYRYPIASGLIAWSRPAAIPWRRRVDGGAEEKWGTAWRQTRTSSQALSTTDLFAGVEQEGPATPSPRRPAS